VKSGPGGGFPPLILLLKYFGLKNKSKNSFILNVFIEIFIIYYSSTIKVIKRNQECPNRVVGHPALPLLEISFVSKMANQRTAF
jgi:hypothetical protein